MKFKLRILRLYFKDFHCKYSNIGLNFSLEDINWSMLRCLFDNDIWGNFTVLITVRANLEK